MCVMRLFNIRIPPDFNAIYLRRVGQERTDVLVLRIQSGQFYKLRRLAKDRTAVVVVNVVNVTVFLIVTAMGVAAVIVTPVSGAAVIEIAVGVTTVGINTEAKVILVGAVAVVNNVLLFSGFVDDVGDQGINAA